MRYTQTSEYIKELKFQGIELPLFSKELKRRIIKSSSRGSHLYFGMCLKGIAKIRVMLLFKL